MGLREDYIADLEVELDCLVRDGQHSGDYAKECRSELGAVLATEHYRVGKYGEIVPETKEENETRKTREAATIIMAIGDSICSNHDEAQG